MNDFNLEIKKIITDIKDFKDSECWNNSRKNEIKYILEKAGRIKYTIGYIREALEYIKKEGREINILDIGTSPFTFLYKRILKSNQSTIDLTGIMKDRCKRNDINFKKCDLLKNDIPFPDNIFDIVIFTEVFEHIMGPPHLVFDRIRRVLKDDGFLIFSTPNLSSYYNLMKLMFGKSILTPVYKLFEEDGKGNWEHKGYGHWRKYTMGELEDLLSRYGFKTLKQKHIIKPYLEIKTKNPIKIIKRLMWNAIVAILPHTQFNLILANKN